METTVIQLDDTTITVHNMVINTQPVNHTGDVIAIGICAITVIAVAIFICYMVVYFIFDSMSLSTQREIKDFFKNPLLYVVIRIKHRGRV